MAKTSALGLAMLCVVLAISPITVRCNNKKEIQLYATSVKVGPMDNSVVVAGRPGPPPPNGDRFGDMTVVDLFLTESPDSNSPRVGKLQGVSTVSSLDGDRVYITESVIIESGKYRVGTLQLQGSLTKQGFAYNGELAVTGGTGTEKYYRFAKGYVLCSTVSQAPDKDVFLLKIFYEIDD